MSDVFGGTVDGLGVIYDVATDECDFFSENPDVDTVAGTGWKKCVSSSVTDGPHESSVACCLAACSDSECTDPPFFCGTVGTRSFFLIASGTILLKSTIVSITHCLTSLKWSQLQMMFQQNGSLSVFLVGRTAMTCLCSLKRTFISWSI